MRPRTLAVLAAGVLLLARANAFAICNASNVCTFANLPASCCGATQCLLDGNITVSSAPGCLLDFSARNVTLTGTLVLGSKTLALQAGSFHVVGVVDGRGAASPDKGGRLVVTTIGGASPAFTVAGGAGNRIDLTGFGDGGGSLEVHADGPVLIGGAINASALDGDAAGGSIVLSTSAGAITVGAPILADALVAGIGGFVDIHAAGNFTVSDAGRISTLSGAGFGGEIDLDAGGTLAIGSGGFVQSNAINGSAGDGGEINLTAGSLDVRGTVEAKGGSDPTQDIGGSGGSISMEAATGPLGLVKTTQGVSVDGAGGGDGGEIVLSTLSPTMGAITIAAPISSQGMGGELGRPGGGGEINVTSAAGITITKSINVGGEGGSTGLVDLFGERDVLVNNSIIGTDPTGGAVLNLGAGHNLSLVDIGVGHNVKADATSSGPGGDLFLSSGNDLAVTDFLLDVSGAGGGKGGSIGLDAGRHLTINNHGELVANSGGGSTLEGGTITLNAGFPDLAGNLQIDGNVRAIGHATTTLVPAPTAIALFGCQVTISSTGLVDSTGDRGATNTIVARKGITINGKLRTSAAGAGGKNLPTYPIGAPPVVTGANAQVSPAFANPCTGCAKPPCTVNDPPGSTACLVPCPTCGNSQVEFPEDCDPAACPTCDIHCRSFGASGCGDGNSCTTDTCDATFGCINQPKTAGAPCDDATVCNGHEACVFENGVQVCKADMPLDCDDDNPCTADTCAAIGGCGHTPLTGTPGDGSGCNNRCTQTCATGECVPRDPPINCDDGIPSTNDSCDSTTGQCIHIQGAACTTNASCADGNPCTSDVCSGNPATCHNTPVTNATPCGNGTVCDGAETCQNGLCTPGTPLDCDDGMFCTDDTCNPVSGCPVPHSVIQGCCEQTADCIDTSACTQDACVNHVCDHILNPNCCQTDADCNDGNPCTDDSTCMNPPNGICSHTPVTGPHAGCGDACTPAAACQSGTCVLGAPLQCASDGNSCTEEICDPALGCQHRPIEGCCSADPQCDDADACTIDSCDPDAHVCVNSPRFLGCKICGVDTDCDDAGACGQSICDTGLGVCAAHTPPDCTDFNTRTADTCVVDGPGQAHCDHRCTCDDGNACNGVETCSATPNGCDPGVALDCNDGKACTDDSCDVRLGCVHVAKTGYASVTCGLDAIAAALQGAAGTDITPGVRTKLTRLLGKARTKLSAAQATTSAKRVQKNLKAAGAKLKAIVTATEAARRRDKIDGGLADAIAGNARGAGDAVETLKTAQAG
ncbi:MAG TPA: hypothetical protein VKA21_09295 [Candidatus Binatia bacterium]|nr:hypothetical protein [Candidatus Binatia bacterium]